LSKVLKCLNKTSVFKITCSVF